MRPARRDAYSDVGRATRDAITAALADPTLTELRVFCAVLKFLTTWSKTSDSISNKQLQEETGLPERAVRRALRSLADARAIELVPGGTERGGQRRAAVIGLPGSGLTPGDSDPGSGATRGQDDPGHDVKDDPGSDVGSDPGSPQPASEELPEEKPEEKSAAPATRSEVELLLRSWWERQDPRPQINFPGALKVLAKAHAAGWTLDDLRLALNEIPVISGGALDFWRRKRYRQAAVTQLEPAARAAASEARLARTFGTGS